jgi:hypothetical protein
MLTSEQEDGTLGQTSLTCLTPLAPILLLPPTTPGAVRQITINDLNVGRNVDEIIRLIKAHQFVEVRCVLGVVAADYRGHICDITIHL